MKNTSFLPIFFFLGINTIFSQKQTADLIVHNAQIYTVNANFDVAEALAIKAGKIIGVGASADIKKTFSAKSTYDAAGKTIVPGFIDAHAHFYGYGESLQTVDLVGTKSWEEILEKCQAFSQKNREGWLQGRGWDQNDWANKEFPTKERLDQLFPKRPILLVRVDGHAAIANQVALDLANLQAGQTLVGGEIETKNSKLTGILVDNAIGLVRSKIPAKTAAEKQKTLQAAERNCFAVGLTTVVDCGVNAEMVELVEKMHKAKTLKMRLNLMLSDDRNNYEYLFKRGIITNDRLTVRSFKLYADGALGSRGACLLHPYADRANHFGFLLKDKTYYEAVMKKIAEHAGMQACTHAIGDSANREILRIYGEILRGVNDRRWRIEHAQVVDNQGFALFKKFSVIPSVQPTHATSDMYWAGTRLGKDREKGAYAFRQLMEQNGWLPLGTDFPVEDINPILTFYAAVVRKDAAGFPAEGYQMNNALTREQTLRGMTIWAAKGHFEENQKGSLEIGKVADFIILNQNLMTTEPANLLKTKVLATFLGGEKVFESRN
jgi:predicted amidohydrolase YtcJ